MAGSSAVRALALEIKGLQDDPLEGIRSSLVDEDNMFEWEVALFGPPDTLYQGGYFKVGPEKRAWHRQTHKNFYFKTPKYAQAGRFQNFTYRAVEVSRKRGKIF